MAGASQSRTGIKRKIRMSRQHPCDVDGLSIKLLLYFGEVAWAQARITDGRIEMRFHSCATVTRGGITAKRRRSSSTFQLTNGSRVKKTLP